MRLLVCALTLIIAFPAMAADDDAIATIIAWHEVDANPTHATVPRLTASASKKNEQLRYTATPENFAAQLDYLTRNGYNVIPLQTLVDHLNGKIATLPPRAVVLTIDDGWACTYTSMLPELRRRKMPFTLFVYPKIVGRGSHAVTWDQVEEIARVEGAEIGSHSYSHPFLTLRNNKTITAEGYQSFLRRELFESKARIEDATERAVRYFCYPFGDYDDAVSKAVSQYGYEAAVTTERGVITRQTSPMRLKRYLVHNTTTLEQFASFLIK